jgi:hypothetical protein
MAKTVEKCQCDNMKDFLDVLTDITCIYIFIWKSLTEADNRSDGK